MPFNLLLFPLLAGYIFIHNDYYFRLKAQTLDGNRLLFEASKYGILFFVVARVFAWGLSQVPVIERWRTHLQDMAPYPYMGTAVIALVLGVMISPIANLRHTKAGAKTRALNRQENVLLKLLNEAAVEGQLVSLTLDTRKWYVGYIVQGPNLDPREQYFAIVPVFSGYRDKDTLEAKRETEYIFDPEADFNEFAKVLSASRIVDANLFDLQLFETYYEHKEPPADESAQAI